MDIKTYEQMLRSGKMGQVTGLCGRIIRGKNLEDFLTLTDDPQRKLVMLMGPDGLEKLLGKTGYEMLAEIGYESSYIVRKVDEGNQFKLIVFKEGEAARLATWDNTIATVAQVYPDVANSLYRNLDILKRTAFDDIEKASGFDWSEVDKAGDIDPRYMTYDRFKQSAGTDIDTRAFLYFTVHLRELFSGDGYTYTNNGTRGLMEYIVANKPITELGENTIIDIKIDLPKIKGGAMNTRKGWPTFWDPRNIGKEGHKADLALARAEARQLKLSPAYKQPDRHLLIVIDLEDDFGDKGRLPVTGTFEDVARLGERFINGILDEYYTDIISTIDIHPPFAIHNDEWWRDEMGNPPVVRPYPVSMKLIDPDKSIFEGSDGKMYRPRVQKNHTVAYAQHLLATNQGNIWVFADHCRQGTDGINVIAPFAELLEWAAVARKIQPMYMYKGMIAEVDWFGPFRPCMDVPTHPQGKLQTPYLDIIAACDTTEITGEALDFCVKAGTLQVMDYYGGKPDVLEKISFLKDTTSAIFPDNPENKVFFDNMIAKGIKIINHNDPFIR